MTTLSIDSGDIDTVAHYASMGNNLITDATTNPLFVSQAAYNGNVRYEAMVTNAVEYAQQRTASGASDDGEGEGGGILPSETTLNIAMDKLAVNLGCELIKLVPGRVSTEVDIRLSYDTAASVSRALSIIQMYTECGISSNRILIKLAGTWEGIRAASILEKEHGIQCNITLVFSILQAMAAGQAGVYLISPFPGRILDWHRKNNANVNNSNGSSSDESSYYTPETDPGVLAVQEMYNYLRTNNYKTICMPASWRPSRGPTVVGSDVDEILALAGVDEMTIPPTLLESLCTLDGDVVVRKCFPPPPTDDDDNSNSDDDNILTEESFKLEWENDKCGQDKLKEGIDAFTIETEKLRKILIDKF
jgi:transaldolase